MGNIPARVDRVTGELQINPRIWSNLPNDYKDYILLHEEGHLKLMTPDEAAANNYAISNYLRVGELTDEEGTRRIVALSEILDPDRTLAFGGSKQRYSNFDVASLISGSLGAIGDIFKTLPALGVGASKAKNNELQLSNNNAFNTLVLQKQSQKSTEKLLLLGSVAAIVVILTVLALKK